jgi:hypothetical protein
VRLARHLDELDRVLVAGGDGPVDDLVDVERGGLGDARVPRTVRAGDRGRDRPRRLVRRAPQLDRQNWEHEGGGAGCGGRVHEHHRVAVRPAAVAGDGRVDQRVERPGNGHGLLHGAEPAERDRPRGRLAEPRDPGARASSGVHRGQRGERARDVGRAGGRSLAGQRLPARGPVAQRRRELVEPLRRLPLPQRAHGVPGADQPVRRGGDRPREQPRPPAGQHVGPRFPVHLGGEQGAPVTEAHRVAERFAPLLLTDRPAGRGLGVQPLRVLLDPPLDLRAAAEADQGVRRHRAVVAQPAHELRAGAVQPLVGLVQHIAHPSSGHVEAG